MDLSFENETEIELTEYEKKFDEMKAENKKMFVLHKYIDNMIWRNYDILNRIEKVERRKAKIEKILKRKAGN